MANTLTTEKQWLDAVEKTFTYAAQQKRPEISRSQVESLLIGGNALRTHPTNPVKFTDVGIATLEKLNKYMDIMRKKNKKFLPIKTA
jgi:predicted solute-binding protein